MNKLRKVLLLGVMMLLIGPIKAQVSVNVNIGSPPLWGPVGYTDVHFYYLPDIEAYYDVHSSLFIYYIDGAWVHRAYLPHHHRGYDLYGGYKVVVNNYNGNTPYIHFKDHKSKYGKGYRGKPQKTIGSSPRKGNSGASKGGGKVKGSGGNGSQGQGKSGNQGKGNKKK